MYDELYRYLVFNKQLNIPGIGNFMVSRKPANCDFPEKKAYPPSYSISLEKESGITSKNLFFALSESMNISDRDAVIKFNDFAFDLKKRITEGEEVLWKGVGTFFLKDDGSFSLTPEEAKEMEEPVVAEKILHENAEHTILVGEKERSSVEMTQFFSQPEAVNTRWWLAPLIVGLIIFLLLFFQFINNDWNIFSVSNQQSITPEKSGFSLISPE
ncbi:MAG: hypothetical protein LC128_04640 [Chitinophagales bacterium]|nr:hypothetical protein [Chitinophagales bacterium]